MERVLPCVARLVQHAPARTVFTRFITPHDPEDRPGLWQTYYRKWRHVTRGPLPAQMLDLVPALAKFAPPAVVFEKGVYSAFASGALHGFLQQHHVNSLIVTGSETDVCVASSVFAAIDHGYRVIIVRDGVCSSSDESHDAIMGFYRNRLTIQVEVAESSEIIAAWRP